MRFIQFIFFVVWFDWKKILEELKKSRRRVKVYILLDGYGSFSFQNEQSPN
jgi:hypothetical protein